MKTVSDPVGVTLVKPLRDEFWNARRPSNFSLFQSGIRLSQPLRLLPMYLKTLYLRLIHFLTADIVCGDPSSNFTLPEWVFIDVSLSVACQLYEIVSRELSPSSKNETIL